MLSFGLTLLIVAILPFFVLNHGRLEFGALFSSRAAEKLNSRAIRQQYQEWKKQQATQLEKYLLPRLEANKPLLSATRANLALKEEVSPNLPLIIEIDPTDTAHGWINRRTGISVSLLNQFLAPNFPPDPTKILAVDKILGQKTKKLSTRYVKLPDYYLIGELYGRPKGLLIKLTLKDQDNKPLITFSNKLNSSPEENPDAALELIKQNLIQVYNYIHGLTRANQNVKVETKLAPLLFATLFEEDNSVDCSIVNAEKNGLQEKPRAIPDKEGNLWISWESQPTLLHARKVILKKISSEGNVLVSDFDLPVEGEQTEAGLKTDHQNNLWISVKTKNSYALFQYDPAGELKNFKNNLLESKKNQNLRLEPLKNGNLVITWEKETENGWDIYAQILQGGQVVKEPFLVNTQSKDDQRQPQISSDNSSNFVVTWTDFSLKQGEIKARLFDGQGETLTEEKNVSDDNVGRADEHPAVQISPGGTIWIVWTNEGRDGNGQGIFGQIYTNKLVPLKNNFRVSRQQLFDQNNVRINFNDNSFVVSYLSARCHGSSSCLETSFYGPTGSLQKTASLTLETGFDTTDYQIIPLVNQLIYFLEYRKSTDVGMIRRTFDN